MVSILKCSTFFRAPLSGKETTEGRVKSLFTFRNRPTRLADGLGLGSRPTINFRSLRTTIALNTVNR